MKTETKKYSTYETERLILTPTSVDDASFILKLMNTPKWLEYIGDRKVYTVQDAEAYIKAKMLPQLERLGYSNFTVSRKTDAAKLGTCGLYDRKGLPGVDIGFAFLPEHEGKGYAFESATKVVELAFSNYGLDELSAITIQANNPSKNLLQRLGFTFEKNIRLSDDPEELMLFKLKKSQIKP